MTDDARVTVASDEDMVKARAEGRAVAARLGFSRTDSTLVATAISEIARNMIVHANGGEIVVTPVVDRERSGLVVVARDHGPGIRDVDSALQDGYSDSAAGGLGLGLPGARRLMDEFEIESAPGRGTTVTMKKWRVRGELERLRERQDGTG